MCQIPEERNSKSRIRHAFNLQCVLYQIALHHSATFRQFASTSKRLSLKSEKSLKNVKWFSLTKKKELKFPVKTSTSLYMEQLSI